MSVVAVVEGLAWLISIGLAVWMVLDMVRVARRNDEQALVDAPDPLEELADDVDDVDDIAAPAPSSAGQDPGRAS